jgi:hypothetical protein
MARRAESSALSHAVVTPELRLLATGYGKTGVKAESPCQSRSQARVLQAGWEHGMKRHCLQGKSGARLPRKSGQGLAL